MIRARHLLREDTIEYRDAGSDQVTVRGQENTSKYYATILNERGRTLFRKQQWRYARGEWIDTINQYCTILEDSGPMSPRMTRRSRYGPVDKGRPRQEGHDTENNICIKGFRDTDEDGNSTSLATYTTSMIVFLTDEWALTRSGTLYKLGHRARRVSNLVDALLSFPPQTVPT